VLLICGDQEKTLNGAEDHTTNNRMELMAAIKALEALKRPTSLVLYTDSTYVKSGMTQWISGWQARGWRGANNKPVKNVDLWQQLLQAAAPHQVTWKWVKGHSGDVHNDRVDALARDAALSIQSAGAGE
jgi:ribonuclease HI